MYIYISLSISLSIYLYLSETQNPHQNMYSDVDGSTDNVIGCLNRKIYKVNLTLNISY